MNVNALIDAIVRQTTVLIAELATSSGGRAHLAHTANQVFLNLVDELKQQGVGSKVIADMFGLALRTYQDKVRRLSESRTVRGRSLWEAVFEHLERHPGPTARADVLARFHHDDGDSVRGVLRDLVNSGVVYRTGRGDGVAYRIADLNELRAPGVRSREGLQHLVWVVVQRLGTASPSAIQATLNLDEMHVNEALQALCERGLVRVDKSGEETRYASHGCVLPFDDAAGWEAAVFDHYQAVVTAICAKLQLDQTHAQATDAIGGSTFGFEVWPDHPHYEEVRGLLASWREQGIALRRRVAAYNEDHDAPREQKERVVAYVGQNVIALDGAANAKEE